MIEESGKRRRTMAEKRQLFMEMRAQNFDVIRLSTYRTACKLRFVQKRCNLHLVDIWNMIEAFRDNGLNTLDHNTEISVSRLETIISSLYFQLNKRLPSTHQISVEQSISLLLNFMIAAYDSEGHGKLTVFSIKAMLATMCGGKIQDKLRYIFSQMSDSNGVMIFSKFDQFLREVLKLPTAVFEGPSFGYTENSVRTCFPQQVKQYLRCFCLDQPTAWVKWLPVAEFAYNNAVHTSSQHTPFELTYGFHPRGGVAPSTNVVSSDPKSPAKKLSHAISKSLGCVPSREPPHPVYPEEPEKPLDLAHIVPSRPLGNMNDAMVTHVSSSGAPTPTKSSVLDSPSRLDEEHRLIARYAARLAAEAGNAPRPPTDLGFNFDANKQQRQLIAELENKNREILQEIQRLRLEHEQASQPTPEKAQQNPTLLAELRLLRQRKDELEQRMSALQESRRELMVQLEGLMKLLKVRPTKCSPTPIDPTSPALTCWSGRQVCPLSVPEAQGSSHFLSEGPVHGPSDCDEIVQNEDCCCCVPSSRFRLRSTLSLKFRTGARSMTLEGRIRPMGLRLGTPHLDDLKTISKQRDLQRASRWSHKTIGKERDPQRASRWFHKTIGKERDPQRASRWFHKTIGKESDPQRASRWSHKTIGKERDPQRPSRWSHKTIGKERDPQRPSRWFHKTIGKERDPQRASRWSHKTIGKERDPQRPSR
uniref:Uncharacterized protein n=1 Tax=Anolis carolinensis TaxID=28377 RepID=H9GK86_ANOCA